MFSLIGFLLCVLVLIYCSFVIVAGAWYDLKVAPNTKTRLFWVGAAFMCIYAWIALFECVSITVKV